MTDSHPPFRIGGVVAGEYFTDRADEVRRIAAALREPQAKLLVYGPRRMGKTSALLRAAERVRGRGGAVVYADLGTASTVADMGTRILQAASRELGRRWRDALASLASRIRPGVSLTMDPVTGVPVMTVEAGRREGSGEEQQRTLGDVLDAVDAMAGERGRTVGVILDEFQEIGTVGGEQAEWHLRGVLQRHEHVGYVLAGSKESLIHAMLGRDRAFYKLFELMHFGPMDGAHLGAWIEDRLEHAGVAVAGIGARVVAAAGPRTRDCLELARAAHLLGGSRPVDAQALVRAAFDLVLREQDDSIRVQWNTLTALQQNLLRAVASGAEQLYSEATRGQFSLGATASVAAALEALVQKGLLERRNGGVTFDNPFTRGWVVVNGLPDVGMLRSPIPDDENGST